jgi:transcriptional regulator with XRE-family HTH domain
LRQRSSCDIQGRQAERGRKSMAKKTRPGLHPIGKVAAAAGVSTQTIRLWEKRGHLSSTRTVGGQRLFTGEMVRRAAELAAESRRAQRSRSVRPEPSPNNLELASTGMRIKRARLEYGLSQQEAAQRIGISRSFLSTVERGESGVSTQVLARMADAFGIPMSGFAAAADQPNRVMRAADRPRTVLAEGVTWEELAAPGRHDLEPALLYVPAGRESGGLFVRPGEAFVLVLQGSLAFQTGENLGEAVLGRGDALILKGGIPFSWRNPGKTTAVCVWVEFIGSVRRKTRETTA